MESVKAVYQQLLKEGKPPKEAAKEAQARTGFSVVTGAPIRRDLGANAQKIAYQGKRKYNGQYPAI